MFKRKKQDDDKDNVLVLMPVKMLSNPSEGSKPYEADCGHECWIAPNSMVALMDPDVRLRTLCAECVDLNAMRESIQKHGLLSLPGVTENVRKQVPDTPFSRTFLNSIKEIYPTKEDE